MKRLHLLLASSLLAGLVSLPAGARAQVINPGGGFSFDPNIGILPWDFNQTRPKLVVLIHGITPEPAQEDPGKINTLKHTRYYWGGQFVKGLQGQPEEDDMHMIVPRKDGLFNMEYTDKLWGYTDDDWKAVRTYPSAMAPVFFPKPWLTYLPPDFETNQAFIKEFISQNTKPAIQKPAMVMITYRDGSKHLMPQVADTVDQIYATYVRMFGQLPAPKQPQIYLVGHSFGGIVARGILNIPTTADLFGNKLTSTQISRARYIRDRVVNVTTISTPHEGTPIVDLAGDIAGSIRTIQSVIRVAIGIVDTSAGNAVAGLFEPVLDAIAGERDCLEDIQRMPEYNRGILNPANHKRSDGTYVPIYTSGGRQPGGFFFDRDRNLIPLPFVNDQPYDIIDIFKGDRPGFEAAAQYLINGLMHIKNYGAENGKPWGTSPHFDYDRKVSAFQYVYSTELFRTLNDPLDLTPLDVVELLFLGIWGEPYEDGIDYENDSDGFVGMTSAHAYSLKNGPFYRLLESAKYGKIQPWDWDNHGSECFNPGTGSFIWNEILVGSGPYALSLGDRFGRWNFGPIQSNPSHSVTVKPIQLSTVGDGADYYDDELSISIEIAGQKKIFHCPEGEVCTNIPAFTVNGIVTSVVPIRISVYERDEPPVDMDDNCVVTPAKARDNLIVFYDTKSGTILGDVKGQAGYYLFARGGGDESRMDLYFTVNGN